MYGLERGAYLEHKSHKYISKKMGSNGKWVYKYTTSSIDTYNVKNGKYTRGTKTEHYERDGDKLFSSKKTYTDINNNKKEFHTVGKIEQQARKGKAWLEKKLNRKDMWYFE